MNLFLLIGLIVLIGLGLFYFDGLWKLIPLFALLGLCYYLYIEPKEQKGGNNDLVDVKPKRIKPVEGDYIGRSRTPVVGEQETDVDEEKPSLRERIKSWWQRKKQERYNKKTDKIMKQYYEQERKDFKDFRGYSMPPEKKN